MSSLSVVTGCDLTPCSSEHLGVMHVASQLRLHLWGSGLRLALTQAPPECQEQLFLLSLKPKPILVPILFPSQVYSAVTHSSAGAGCVGTTKGDRSVGAVVGRHGGGSSWPCGVELLGFSSPCL